MAEKVIVKIITDGVELDPIDMGEWHQDAVYGGDITLYSRAHAFNKQLSLSVYDCSIRLTRHKTDEERRMEFKR